MAEKPHDSRRGHVEVYDRELNLRAILGFSGGVIAITLLASAIMWWMSVSFKRQEEAEDHTPSPIAEAQLDPIPPGPRLQANPPRDMDELRKRDREALTTYGWIDKTGGVARIPVERAIEILAEDAAKSQTLEKWAPQKETP
jgi:hypothetical protein